MDHLGGVRKKCFIFLFEYSHKNNNCVKQEKLYSKNALSNKN